VAETDVLIIAGGTVLAGIDLQPIAEAAIAVDDGRVIAMGPEPEIRTQFGSHRVLDVSGLTLMPGFIDCHVHIGFYEPADVLEGGVTTVRDLGWPPEEIFALVSESGSGGFRGPLITAVGPMLTAPDGYPARASWAPKGTALELTDAAAAGDAVRDLAARGACSIKIALNPPVGPVLDDAVLFAIVDVAHTSGLKVTAHIYGLDQLRRAIDAGVDELAHTLTSSELISEETTKRMVDTGMALVPTLSIFSGEALEVAVANVDSFRRAGGRILYGTDLGNAGPRPGIDPLEIEGMRRAGMSGAEIIAAATSFAAAHIGLEGKGSLVEGHDADIIGVRGDPIADPSSLCAVEFVMREGVVARAP
jgi:imidazolonepropionase-like amidohydrolase